MGENKDSEKKVIGSAKEQAPFELLSFCDEQLCVGIKPKFAHLERNNEECPVCFESLNSKGVLMLDKCRHMFCQECIKIYNTKYLYFFLFYLIY